MTRLATGRRLLLVLGCALAASGCVPGMMTGTIGKGTAGFSGDGGPAGRAEVDSPGDLVMTASGVVYVVDGNCVIRRVDTQGLIATVAGRAGVCGDSGDGGQATASSIDPFGSSQRVDGLIAVDGTGNIYLDDRGAGRVRRITPAGTISTVLDYGAGQAWIATDLQGRLLVNVYSTVAGSPYDGIYRREANGTYTLLQPDTPLLGLAVGPDGSWYGTTRFLAPAGVVSSIFRWYPNGDRVLVASTVQGAPPITDLEVTADGTVYASGGNQVLVVDDTDTITPVAGTGEPHLGIGTRIGEATAMDITPRAIARGATGILYVSSGHTVYRFWLPT